MCVGYVVSAPDLPGHGVAPPLSSYTFAAHAEYLLPLFTGPNTPPYDVIIGHSLGTLVALALTRLIPSFSGHIILVDPPFEVTPDLVERTKQETLEEARHPKSAEEYVQEMGWPEMDAVWRVTGIKLCKESVLTAIFDVINGSLCEISGLDAEMYIFRRIRPGHTCISCLRPRLR